MRHSCTERPKKIVDFHVHAFPDKVAPRAIETLATRYQAKAHTDGTVAGLLAHMERAGVDHAVIMPVATKPEQVPSINDWAAALHDAQLIPFGAIHPLFTDTASEVDRIVSLGLPGIKIQANWQDVYVDDPLMYPIYEAAEGRLIILFHSGDELTPFDDLKATPERLAAVHRDFPSLTMVAAHMGGYRMWEQVEEHLIGKPVYLDTSACFPSDLPDDRMADMIRRHGFERILFATDLPFGNPIDEIPRLAAMGFSDEELDLIMWRNAQRLLPGHV